MIRLFDTFWTLTNMVRKMNKIKDSVSLGLASGLLATIGMDISDALLFRAKKTEMLIGQLSGSMIMRPFRMNQRKNFILGQIIHMITGSILGVPLTYVLKRTGKDQHLLKGAVMGLLSWGVLYDFGQRMGFFSTRAHLTKTHYSELWNNLLYGLIASQAIVTLGDSTLFPQPNQVSSEQSENLMSEILKETESGQGEPVKGIDKTKEVDYQLENEYVH